MLQSQVFVALPYFDTADEQAELIESVMALHRNTTARFRDVSRQRKHQSVSSKTVR